MRTGRCWNIYWHEDKQKWIVKSDILDDIYVYTQRARAFQMYCELESHTMKKFQY